MERGKKMNLLQLKKIRPPHCQLPGDEKQAIHFQEALEEEGFEGNIEFRN